MSPHQAGPGYTKDLDPLAMLHLDNQLYISLTLDRWIAKNWLMGLLCTIQKKINKCKPKRVIK